MSFWSLIALTKLMYLVFILTKGTLKSVNKRQISFLTLSSAFSFLLLKPILRIELPLFQCHDMTVCLIIILLKVNLVPIIRMLNTYVVL